MKAAVLEGKRIFAVRDLADPVPGPGEVLVKVRYCGICGSDLHIFSEGAAVGAGHEYSGDIAAVGEGVTGWAVGDRVAVEPCISCGECFWCQRGEIGLCENYYAALVEYKGAFATHTRVDSGRLYPVPHHITYEEAALIEPATCAFHAVKLSGLREGDTVAVLGLGPIGQLVARLARAMGAGAVYASEISRSRIALAGDIADAVIDPGSANTVDEILRLMNGKAPDVVFECAGNTLSTQESLALVRKGGTIVAAGICLDPVHLSFSNIVLRGLTVKGSICWTRGEYASTFELVKEGRIELRSLVTDVMPLDRINDAFEKASRADGGKILISP
ncbi:MAG: alcohol dehydrogenase catalytic domain-containing protein [Dehalococcoidia bacterium]|nr:alcohol dehydrogenase catalytic domain-containing protein [Dehalococcoidia bacterium]